MRSRERPSAQACIILQCILLGDFAYAAEPPVFEDANIELSCRRLVRGPAEEDVARRLHHALAFDNAVPLRSAIDILWPEPFERGRLRFLHLQEQGLFVTAE